MIGLPRGKVQIVPHHWQWKSIFESEATLLGSLFPDVILQIEHIGSTAIEGMAAKPIIDLMGVVASLEEAKPFRAQLERVGYEYRPDATAPDRIFFAKGPRSHRTHHLSLTARGSTFYKEKLLFRDYLRANAEAAEEYRRLKEELATKYGDNRGAYTEGKSDFVKRILDLASREKTERSTTV